jgi:hypothetical protein
MIHKKSCFGRTFEQDTQASEPDGKSWSDDKFYENIRTRKETTQAQHGQWRKQGASPSVLDNAFNKLSALNSGPDEDPDFWFNHRKQFDMGSHPGYSNVPGNPFYSDD